VPGNLAKSNLAHGSRTVMSERSPSQPAWSGQGRQQYVNPAFVTTLHMAILVIPRVAHSESLER
jgi:hypothetical protein